VEEQEAPAAQKVRPFPPSLPPSLPPSTTPRPNPQPAYPTTLNPTASTARVVHAVKGGGRGGWGVNVQGDSVELVGNTLSPLPATARAIRSARTLTL
jgi:anti-sigma factor RsiW